MAIGDLSVYRAVARANQVNGVLTYSGVQDIIRSVFDNGRITVLERDDLRHVLTTMAMDERAKRALTHFLTHVSAKLVPAEAIARQTGNRNQGVPLAVPDPGPFQAFNTDLGKFSHGNFDALYIPGDAELWIVLKVKYQFERGLHAGDHSAARTHLRQGVRAWDNAEATLETNDFVLNPVIRIRFIVREVTAGAHKTVDVEAGERREWVGMDINVHKNTTAFTYAHELGHVFGNYDEYRGSGLWAWIERRLYWHDNRYLSDTAARMNGGTEFRARYFDHMQRFVNRHFAKVKAKYRVVLPS